VRQARREQLHRNASPKEAVPECRLVSKHSFEALGYRLLSLGEDMQRREFIGTAAWPFAARAQQPENQ
jgi:hypothetical protein